VLKKYKMELDTQKYLSDLVEKGKQNPKVKFEFQELGLEMERIFGKELKARIWSMFYEKGMTESRIRRSLEEFEKRKFNYFQWILNKVIK
jgi:hypothetical protein